MMHIQSFVFNPFRENTFVIYEGKESIVIDPGCQTRKEQAELENFLVENKLSVSFVLNTHLHVDHIYGNQMLSEKFSAKVFAHARDDIERKEPLTRKRQYWPFSDTRAHISEWISESSELSFSDSKIQILETPGHSAGSLSFYFPKEKIVFVGDVLERGALGSLEYIYSDERAMRHSAEKLLTLPGEVRLFFGHGESCTVEEERNFLQGIL